MPPSQSIHPAQSQSDEAAVIAAAGGPRPSPPRSARLADRMTQPISAFVRLMIVRVPIEEVM